MDTLGDWQLQGLESPGTVELKWTAFGKLLPILGLLANIVKYMDSKD